MIDWTTIIQLLEELKKDISSRIKEVEMNFEKWRFVEKCGGLGLNLSLNSRNFCIMSD